MQRRIQHTIQLSNGEQSAGQNEMLLQMSCGKVWPHGQSWQNLFGRTQRKTQNLQ